MRLRDEPLAQILVSVRRVLGSKAYTQQKHPLHEIHAIVPIESLVSDSVLFPKSRSVDQRVKQRRVPITPRKQMKIPRNLDTNFPKRRRQYPRPVIVNDRINFGDEQLRDEKDLRDATRLLGCNC